MTGNLLFFMVYFGYLFHNMATASGKHKEFATDRQGVYSICPKADKDLIIIR